MGGHLQNSGYLPILVPSLAELNFGAIISRADFPVHPSSIHELYDVLISGIFLDDKKQKFWVVKRGGIYINCFMVYGSNMGPSIQTRMTRQWSRDYALNIHMRKQLSRQDSVVWDFGSDGKDEREHITIIAYPNVILHGKIRSADLSLNVTYEIIWVVMLPFLSGFDKLPIVHTEFSCRDHEPPVKQHRKIGTEEINQWVQVWGGEFETKPTISKEIQFSIHYAQSQLVDGMLVKGFIIQPKP